MMTTVIELSNENSRSTKEEAANLLLGLRIIRGGFSEEVEIDVDFEGCIGIYQEKLSKGIIRSETSTFKA